MEIDIAIAMLPKVFTYFPLLLLQAATLGLGLSLLQPLPDGYDPGEASVVYVRDNLVVLPDPFHHTKQGNICNCHRQINV